ncbi:MAG: hypothetical protein JWQ02_3368, partial [Capsulimonas sp.]|nr:hypothetical protein [Capsulimonas sp.]
DYAKVNRVHDMILRNLLTSFEYADLAAFHGIPGHGRTIARRFAALRRRVEMAPIKRSRQVPQDYVTRATSEANLRRKAIALARLEIKHGREYADIAEADIRILCAGRMCTTKEAHAWIYEMYDVDQEQQRETRQDTPNALSAAPSQNAPLDDNRELALAA